MGELALVVGALLRLVVHRQRPSILFQASALGVLALLSIYFHPVAFGYADDQGIVFCRYFRLHFVPWNEVARVDRPQFRTFELVVRLGRRVGLTKTVKFAMNFAGQEVSALRDGWTPKIMTWLKDRLSPAQAPTSQGRSQGQGCKGRRNQRRPPFARD